MTRKEFKNLAIMTAIMIGAIVLFAFLFRILGLADSTQTLPEPEYTPANEIILLRAEAPERTNTGLATYETFDEALERTRAAVPDELAELAGRAVWGEAGGIQDYAQRAAVVWCACNRADAWGETLEQVLVPSQFHGLLIAGDVPEEHLEVARDVLARWTLEHDGWVDVGRVLPSQYLFFEGDGQHNYFSTEYGGGEYWRGW